GDYRDLALGAETAPDRDDEIEQPRMDRLDRVLAKVAQDVVDRVERLADVAATFVVHRVEPLARVQVEQAQPARRARRAQRGERACRRQRGGRARDSGGPDEAPPADGLLRRFERGFQRESRCERIAVRHLTHSSPIPPNKIGSRPAAVARGWSPPRRCGSLLPSTGGVRNTPALTAR